MALQLECDRCRSSNTFDRCGLTGLVAKIAAASDYRIPAACLWNNELQLSHRKSTLGEAMAGGVEDDSQYNGSYR